MSHFKDVYDVKTLHMKIERLEREKDVERTEKEQARRILSLLLQTIWANPSYVNTTQIYKDAQDYLSPPIKKSGHANEDFGVKL
jgi:hypothetical protein